MNPLTDFEGYCHKVSTPEELRLLMGRIGNGFKLRDYLYYKEFVERYWLLDPGLGRWMRLLGVSGSISMQDNLRLKYA